MNHQALREKADHEKRLVALSSVGAAVLLTSMKLVVGLFTGSLGILSEAAHSALDLVAAVVTFFAVRISGRPPDTTHAYGHGKIENLSALFETLLLLMTCIWIIYEAIQRLFFKSVEIEASPWAFVVMLVSIAVDFTRSRALKRIAIKYDSQALEADALHFSTDIWSSSVVIGGLVLVSVSEWLNLPWLLKADAVAAMGVAGIVINVSLQLGRKTIADLLDAMPPGQREEAIHAVQHIDGVMAVEEPRFRRSGPEVFADMTLLVSRETTLEKAQAIAEAAEKALQSVIPNVDVVFNVAPVIPENEDMLTTVRMLAARHGIGAHGMRIYDSDGGLALELHLEIDDKLTLNEAHDLSESFEADVHRAIPRIHQIDTHLEPAGEGTSLSQPSADNIARDKKLLLEKLAEVSRETGVTIEYASLSIWRVTGELMVSFHCHLPPDMSMTEAHLVTVKVEQALRARIHNLGRVVIHVEPVQISSQ
jgi:cation diffusion facilitator family transporter